VHVLREELVSYSAVLAARPRLLVGTKLDLPASAQGLADLRAAFPQDRILAISSFSRDGINELKKAILGLAGAAAAAAGGDGA
jgi:GTP-binding protein